MEKSNPNKMFLFFLLFLCFASAILGDSTAESLLLSHFDARYIPKMYLINAAALFIISAFLMPVFDRVNRGNLFISGLMGHGVMLILIRIAIWSKLTFFFGPLFSYAYVSKIIIFLTFWTLANDLFDSRKAGKVFPVIAAGGTSGAIAVSFSIPWLMKIISAENLLLLWIILVFLSLLLFWPIKIKYGRFFKARPDTMKAATPVAVFQNISILRDEPLVRNMAILYFALFFLLLNQHFSFYSQVKLHFSNANNVATFLGYFNGVSMFFTFALQMTVSGKLLNAAGSTRSMLVVPVVMVIIFGTLFFLQQNFPHASGLIFGAVVIGMGLRIACFDSFFSPNFQIFFSSLPTQLRGRGKLAIEGVVKPLAILCSSLWMLWAVPVLTAPVNMGILFVIALLVIFQTFRLRTHYTSSLTGYLSGYSSKKQAVVLEQLVNAMEQKSYESLRHKLHTENSEIQEFIIELLAKSSSPEAVSILKESLDCNDKKIRATLVSSLGKLCLPDLKDRLLEFLNDSDDRVVANAVQAVAGYKDESVNVKLESLLHHANNRVQANVIIALWPYATDSKKAALLDLLQLMLSNLNANLRASALYALGEIDGVESFLMIRRYFYKCGEEYKNEQVIFRQLSQAIAKKKDESSVVMLLAMAKEQNQMRIFQIIHLLGALVSGLPETSLVKLLRKVDLFDRNLVIQALHSRTPVLSADFIAFLKELVHQELERINGIFHSVSILFTCRNPGIELLCHALIEEFINVYIAMTTHVASLADHSGAIRKIIPRLSHTDSHVRARAFEVLDNSGDFRLNRLLIHTIERKERALHHSETLNIKQDSVYELLTGFMVNDRAWIGRCAGYALSCMAENQTKC